MAEVGKGCQVPAHPRHLLNSVSMSSRPKWDFLLRVNEVALLTNRGPLQMRPLRAITFSHWLLHLIYAEGHS